MVIMVQKLACVLRVQIIFKLVCIALLLFGISFVSAGSAQNEPIELKAKIEKYLAQLEDKRFSGSVLVEYQGEVLLSKGYGKSNREKGFDYKPETVSDMGSVTKQFTAAAILKLEMQGKLSVEDKISSYIANVPSDKSALTIHHLLTHSSGLHLYSGDDFEAVSEKDFLSMALSQKLLFVPGSNWGYSNTAYSLLAWIIEKVSGQSYETYLYQNLFKPANMENTGYSRPQFNPDNLAVGYRGRELWGKPTEMPWDGGAPYWHLKGNGGLLSTSEDFYKWHQVLLTNKVLSAAAKAKYFYPHVIEDEKKKSYYSYGWFIEPSVNNTQLIHHNGGNGIIFSDFFRYLEEKITVIVFSNSYDSYSFKIARQISNMLLDKNYQPEEKYEYKELIELYNQGEDIKDIVQLIKAGKVKPSDYQLSERAINHFGYQLVSLNKMAESLIIFQLNTQLHPMSANTYDSYGEVLIESGDIKNGVKAYQKALDLDPQYGGEKTALEIIEKYRSNE
jgi:CubicO group peptidase (beta-lactamase class C family)